MKESVSRSHFFHNMSFDRYNLRYTDKWCHSKYNNLFTLGVKRWLKGLNSIKYKKPYPLLCLQSTILLDTGVSFSTVCPIPVFFSKYNNLVLEYLNRRLTSTPTLCNYTLFGQTVNRPNRLRTVTILYLSTLHLLRLK